MKFLPYFTLLLLFTLPHKLSSNSNPKFIIWNVGQGQWLTYISLNSCIHFDMGGEHNPIKDVLKNCRARKNYLLISHPDWDHISFVRSFLKKVPNLCILNPLRKIFSRKELRKLVSIPTCSSNSLKVHGIRHLTYPYSWQKNLNINSKSQIYIVAQTILIPGDSVKKDEKLWSRQISPNNKIKYLIVGHHGSKTSTSHPLLSKLPQLQQAISSSRKKRFGHPHIKTIESLGLIQTPLISTEQMGHIVIWL